MMSPSHALLALTDVGLNIAGRQLLQDINVQANAGEMIVLLGPNGAGKSSLLRLLAREFSEHQGDVTLAGQSLLHWSAPNLARRRAVMPQQTPVAFPFAAAEVVALGLPGRLSGQVNHPLVYSLMSALQVDHLARRFYSGLSGGEQQRVQLARVLAQLWLTTEPKLLLLDECTSALDPAQQYRVMSLLAKLARRGDFCVIAACHDLPLAASCATRLWMLEQGQLVADGSPAEVLQPARLEKVYGIRARVEQGANANANADGNDAGAVRIYVEGCCEPLTEPQWPEDLVVSPNSSAETATLRQQALQS